MEKTTMTIWRGLRTIGGNIAEIRYGNDRVIFDFGLVFDPAGALLEQSTNRDKSYVNDMLRLGILPEIDGVYREANLQRDLSELDCLQSFEASTWNTGVFVSHLHIDHMGALGALAPDIPVFMSQDSARLFQALNTVGEESKHYREVTAFWYQTPIQIGSIKVTPYRVDHDVIGAVSLHIETPDLNIIYSGDLRMHGEHPDWNETWLKEMEGKNIDLLFMEGTTFRPAQEKEPVSVKLCQTENEIAATAAKLIQPVEGLAIFNMYHRNIKRIRHFAEAAKLTDRKLVLEPETAYLAAQLLDGIDFLMLDTGEAEDGESDWKKTLQQSYRQISMQEINQAPGGYVLQNSFHLLMNLLDLDVKGSIYIHSNGMPLGDYDPNYQKLHAFLERFDITYQSLDVSGHASQQDVLHIIDRIKPGVLIPWHSHFPELVKPLDNHQAVMLPEAEVTYVYEDGRLIPQ